MNRINLSIYITVYISVYLIHVKLPQKLLNIQYFDIGNLFIQTKSNTSDVCLHPY